MAKNWAIAIGVNHYEHLPSSAHLSYAVSDAELMRNFLCNTAGFPADQVLLCSDKSPKIGALSTRPSRSNIRRILREELQQAQGADNLWFFFAGHGMAGRMGDHFLPIDGNPNDLEDTAVSVHFVTECLRRCQAKNVVLVLDMCRNEGQTDSRDISVNVGEQTIELAREQGMITMFSCSRGERSYEIPALGQGAFTYCLVNGLQQHTILRQLDGYLQQEIPNLRQRYARQIPVPRIIPEPGWKYDAPLLPGYATQSDVGQLIEQATQAELNEEFEHSRQLWWQIVDAGSQAERANARQAIERIQRKGESTVQSTFSTRDPTLAAQAWSASPVAAEQNSLNLSSSTGRLLVRRKVLQTFVAAGVGVLGFGGLRLLLNRFDDLPDRYSQLEGFLQAQQWRNADQETAQLMLNIANRAEVSQLSNDDIRNFPCEVLSAVDRLWLRYSSGKFAFSVQSQIYFEGCSGNTCAEDEDAYQRFSTRVGWLKNNQGSRYSELQFNTQAPDGHLPARILSLGTVAGCVGCAPELVFSLMQRYIACSR